jgi:hypothetical protein
MASLIGMLACWTDASAHGGYGYSDIYSDRRYAAYERYREARERYRLRREERAYERHMGYQKRLAERRRRLYDRSWDFDRGEWRRLAHRAYRNYETYCDCPEYRDYVYAPRIYGYYGDREYYRDYRHYGHRDYHGYHDYSHYMLYPRVQKNDRIWTPDAYPAGWPSWWLRMDRESRGGRN